MGMNSPSELFITSFALALVPHTLLTISPSVVVDALLRVPVAQ